MRQAIANHTARVQVRPWPGNPSMCHLTLLDVDMIPTHDDVARWVDDVRTSTDQQPGYRTIRTGALFPAAAEPFVARGFVEVDRLALLERSLDQPPTPRRALGPPPDTSVIRLRERDLPRAGEIDAASFDADWRNDASALADVANATPQSRRRLVVERPQSWLRARIEPPTGDALAFAITGRAGHNGYLQRLAVRPDARRRGLARHLVDDACRWLTQRGAQRVLVNTGIDNAPALALYERCGFALRTDELVVLQLDVTG